MSESPSRPSIRITQVIVLTAAAALIVFMLLLGTDTITPDGGTILVIGGVLVSVAFIGTMLEMANNQAGKPADKDTTTTNE
jgi:hypothetical protein